MGFAAACTDYAGLGYAELGRLQNDGEVAPVEVGCNSKLKAVDPCTYREQLALSNYEHICAGTHLARAFGPSHVSSARYSGPNAPGLREAPGCLQRVTH